MTDAPAVPVPQFVARPDKMMGFTDAVKNCVRNNYLGFSGRASRSEYWWFMLFLQIVPIVGYVLVFAYISVALGEEGATMSFETLMNLLTLPGLATLAFLLPALSVSVRRLHDTGKSGWMLLITLIPCIGLILWLVWMIEDGQAHDNAYGSVPTNLLE
tara:strand:+ start:271 stop:744 length:474 start_codon:yes stop_codon:yes gene_type:complete